MKPLFWTICLVLAGCASTPTVPPIPQVQMQTLEVPVPVQREVPAELAQCGADLPMPVAKPAESPNRIAFDEAGANQLLTLIRGLKGCTDAWRLWAGGDGHG